MKWRVEDASCADIPFIASGMREADRREVWASHRHTPRKALEQSFSLSVQAWTCFVEDTPAFMWGVTREGSILSETGIPWLLGTEALYGVRRDFLKQSHAYIAQMHEHFSCLHNYVHGENTLSIRWLRWCGFTVNEVPEVIRGERFYSFRREWHA